MNTLNITNRPFTKSSFFFAFLFGGFAALQCDGALLINSIDHTGSGVLIADNSSLTSTLSLASIPGDTITAISVGTNLSASGSGINSDGTTSGSGNPYNNELRLTLTSPLGTNLDLISFGTYNYDGATTGLVALNFADGGTTQTGNTLNAGTYAPAGGNLSVFNGEDPTGNWTLTIYDNAGSDPKSLNAWSLTVTTPAGSAAVPEPNLGFVLWGGMAGLVAFRRQRR